MHYGRTAVVVRTSERSGPSVRSLFSVAYPVPALFFLLLFGTILLYRRVIWPCSFLREALARGLYTDVSVNIPFAFFREVLKCRVFLAQRNRLLSLEQYPPHNCLNLAHFRSFVACVPLYVRGYHLSLLELSRKFLLIRIASERDQPP